LRIAYICSTFLVAAIPLDIPLYAKEFSLLIAKGGLVLGGLTLKIEPMYIQVLKKKLTQYIEPQHLHMCRHPNHHAHQNRHVRGVSWEWVYHANNDLEILFSLFNLLGR